MFYLFIQLMIMYALLSVLGHLVGQLDFLLFYYLKMYFSCVFCKGRKVNGNIWDSIKILIWLIWRKRPKYVLYSPGCQSCFVLETTLAFEMNNNQKWAGLNRNRSGNQVNCIVHMFWLSSCWTTMDFRETCKTDNCSCIHVLSHEAKAFVSTSAWLKRLVHNV